MFWVILVGAAITLICAPADPTPRMRRDPDWFTILRTLQPTGRRARRSR